MVKCDPAARPKRRFIRFADGVPLWCGPSPAVHCAFHRPTQARKVRQAVEALRSLGRPWAVGWEGDRFVLSFLAGGGKC